MKSVFTRTYSHLLTRLIMARKKAGLSQTDVAKRLKKPQSFVSKYERGERRLDVVEFVRVAKAVGADAGALIGEIEREMEGDRR